MNENQVCPASVRGDLKAFADGELSPFARFSVARHLRGCPACREELIQMQTISNELREGEVEEAPLSSELRAHILDSVPPPDAVEEQEVSVRSRRVARKKAVLALGACSVAGILLLVTINSTTTTRQTFDKASDSMSAGDDAPSTIFGRSGNGSAPSAASSAGAAKVQTDNDANGGFSDGHFKALSPQPFAANEAELSQRLRGARRAGTNSTASDSAANSTVVTSEFSAPVVPATRAVHREGSLSVAVDNAENASDNATMIIKNAGGFVANTSLETGGGQKRTAVLDCRVPVDKFEIVVMKIGQLGHVRAKSLSGQDITAQVAQSGARRQTLSQELSIAQARLAQKEKERKPNAGDLYELRAEVRTLRIQASQARAALETLQKYGSLSSLYVSLQDGLPSATPKVAGWTDSLSPTTRAAWEAFLSNARLPLQLLMWVLAYSPLWIPALLVWRKYGQKWLTS